MNANNLKRKLKYIMAKKELLVCALLFSIVSCTVDPARKYSPEMKHDELGVQFMDDMYSSIPYDTYGENSNFENGMEARQPVEGTVPRGYLPYAYANTVEGYTMAGDSLENPIALNNDVLAKGKDLYGKFCVHCHGDKGQGDGIIVQNGKFPPPPSYSTGASSGGGDMKDLADGKIFHSITYGKNLMGSHASQLTQEERWTIIHYVNTLQNPLGEKTEVEEDVQANNDTE